jgi:hypothetical protein
VIQITPQMRILVAIEAVDGRKYAPSMDMRSRAAASRKIGSLQGHRRRITGATVWNGALRAVYPAAGSDRGVRSAGPKMPSPPAFPWDQPVDRPPCFGGLRGRARETPCERRRSLGRCAWHMNASSCAAKLPSWPTKVVCRWPFERVSPECIRTPI